MIKKLQIKNFRGIQNLEVTSLAKFNIIIGKNGTGKTSILEAVSLASSGLKAEHFFKIVNGRRHYAGHENEILDSIFPNTERVEANSPMKPAVKIKGAS